MSDPNNLQPTGTEARVCQDIAARQLKGLQKYGTTVQDNPLGLLQWLQHAYEETLDQAVYLKRAIEQLQGVAPDAQPKAHINLPVVELPASMRCGDAINVPPLKAGKSWCPAGVEWIEVPLSYRSRPPELADDTYVNVLFLSERQEELYRDSDAEHARSFNWDQQPNDPYRIVAYKVVE